MPRKRKNEIEDLEIAEENVPQGESDGPAKRGRKAKDKVKEASPAEIEIKPVGKRGRKKAEPPAKKQKTEDSDENEAEKKSVQQKQKPPKALQNKSLTDYSEINFECTKTTSSGDPWNYKISTWNVDGIRAWMNKGGLDYIKHEKPDILCLQETKCSLEKLPEEITGLPDYEKYWVASKSEGYAGVGIYTKKKPLSVVYGLGKDEFDNEGRIITLEFEKFYVISTYVPNSGRGLVTLPKRLEWNKAFREYIKDLDTKKPVIICGDMNVSHLEIDLANPKTNKKNAGFTQEERDGMTEFLSDGFVDTFRKLYPEKTGAYTFWTYMSNCRSKNVGWRLDYAIVSERLMPAVCDNIIRNEVFGSDHCPLTLFLKMDEEN